MSEDMEQAVRLVLDFYTAFNEGDFDAAVEHLHPEVVWERVAGVERPLRGREAVRQFLAPGVFAAQRTDIHEAEIVGDCVLVRCTFHGRGAGSGVELNQQGFHLWRIRDGLAAEFRYFLDRDEAVRAAGDASA